MKNWEMIKCDTYCTAHVQRDQWVTNEWKFLLKKKIEKCPFRLLMYLFEFWNYSYVLKLLSYHETSAAGKWKIYLSNLNRQIIVALGEMRFEWNHFKHTEISSCFTPAVYFYFQAFSHIYLVSKLIYGYIVWAAF